MQRFSLNLRQVIGIVLIAAVVSLLTIGDRFFTDLPLFGSCAPPKKLQCAGKDLEGQDFTGLDLSGADFSNANLSGTVLIGTKLIGADLRGANLSRSNLRKAVLSNAKLQQAILEHAYAKEARFQAANLEGTNLQFSNLTSAVLSFASLEQANLHHANLTGSFTKGTNFDSARFSYTIMTDGKIRTGVYRKPQAPPSTLPSVSKKEAVSLRCQDGMVSVYCQIRWSDGSYSGIPWGVGPRKGGVVDSIIYYDLQWNPMCILLYADGSILTSYDLGYC